MLELLKNVLEAVDVFKRSDEAQRRANLNAMTKARRKLYRYLKKDGNISEEDNTLLNKADTAIVEAMISLGKLK